MRNLYIIGAGGLGREVFSWLKQSPEIELQWRIAGFFDDRSDALRGFCLGVDVVGSVSDIRPSPESVFVCAIGSPRIRLALCRSLMAKGVQFHTVRHKTVVFGEDCRIGVGCILCPGVVVTTNVEIGNFVVVNAAVTIGHDARVGDGVTISGHADVTGFAEISEGAFLGSHASILPGARVGAHSTVGAGSVVLKKVSAGATVMGVPAKQIIP